jgi:hypothetical protein
MRTALASGVLMVVAMTVYGQSDPAHGEKERQQDAARHRALAALHEAAARCIDAGTPVKECHEQLRKDCRGLGIGRYCGMRHKH